MSHLTSAPLVLDLSGCTADRADLVGGKSIGLARLLADGFNVPPGFAVTTAAYRRAVAHLAGDIETALKSAGTPAGDADASEKIRALIEAIELPDDLDAAITDAYAAMAPGAAVAVRSSADAEDTADASFAGQQDSYLWIEGAEAVKRRVIDCWASLFTDRAIAYRARQNVPPASVAMGVVVQLMVDAEAAGVMMTIHPVTGERSEVYVESSYGLGEAVVRGEVTPDTFRVAKANGAVLESTVGSKRMQYRFEAETGTVVQVPVDADIADQPSVTAAEVAELAATASSVERAFGRPMDIEWGIGRRAEGAPRELFLLQARPETVWSNRTPEPADVLDSTSAPHLHWTRSNAGEAVPGVLTPLNWSIWGTIGERTVRGVGYATGATTKAEAIAPVEAQDKVLRIFRGRLVLSVEFMGLFGDRMPGFTGEQAVESIFGRVPETMMFRPTRRRYPIVAAKMLTNFVRYPGVARRLAREASAWWRESTERLSSLDRIATQQLFEDALVRFEQALGLQSNLLFIVTQPVFELLQVVAGKAGVDDVSALGGTGHAEMDLVTDLWRASRGQIKVEEVVRRHGYHGPQEGEIASRVWREDDTPLRALVEQYRVRPDTEDPVRAEHQRARRRTQVARQVMRSFPLWQRPAIGLVLRLGRTRMPMRGVVKRSFLQALDVARGSARRIGEFLVADGVIDNADDVFFLLTTEMRVGAGADMRQLVRARRRQWQAHHEVELPGEWQGNPEVTVVGERKGEPVDSLTGIGVSPGVVEGIARVITRPDFLDVEHGEILVAPYTDPSWSSVMFISSALVVDIGGALSHAAVIARELAVPCVVNTQRGTSVIATGDRIRVDGSRGVVEIIDGGN